MLNDNLFNIKLLFLFSIIIGMFWCDFAFCETQRIEKQLGLYLSYHAFGDADRREPGWWSADIEPEGGIVYAISNQKWEYEMRTGFFYRKIIDKHEQYYRATKGAFVFPLRLSLNRKWRFFYGGGGLALYPASVRIYELNEPPYNFSIGETLERGKKYREFKAAWGLHYGFGFRIQSFQHGSEWRAGFEGELSIKNGLLSTGDLNNFSLKLSKLWKF